MSDRVIREWKGRTGGVFTAVCQRTENGRWIIGTRGAPGGYAQDALDYATDQEAMEFLEEQWGYLPSSAVPYFPPEMVD